MRRILPVLMLLSLTATALAQTPQTRVRESSRYQSSPIKMEFGHAVETGTVVEISGGAKFTIDGAVITADGATLDKATQEVTLRGNVRMRFTK